VHFAEWSSADMSTASLLGSVPQSTTCKFQSVRISAERADKVHTDPRAIILQALYSSSSQSSTHSASGHGGHASHSPS
jgi:hypothetical protein